MKGIFQLFTPRIMLWFYFFRQVTDRCGEPTFNQDLRNGRRRRSAQPQDLPNLKSHQLLQKLKQQQGGDSRKLFSEYKSASGWGNFWSTGSTIKIVHPLEERIFPKSTKSSAINLDFDKFATPWVSNLVFISVHVMPPPISSIWCVSCALSAPNE